MSKISKRLRRLGSKIKMYAPWNLRRALNHRRARWEHKRKVSRPTSLPPNIIIEPNNYCNLSCPTCHTGCGTLRRPRGRMTMETVRLLLQNMGRYVEKVDLSGSGEPFMFDDIVEIIERCKRYGIMVTAATNCHFFTNPDFCRAVIRSGIDEIVGAIDGVTQESLKSFRGEKADLERVISGTRQLVEERNRLKSRRPLLNMLFVVNRFNEPDIEKALELAGEIGCDSLVPKYVGIDLMEREQERFLPEDLSRTRYEQKPDGTIGLKGDIQDKCATMYMNPMITWNGDVLPCCYDFHGDSVMGNVNEENFSSIWKSDRFARFRENVNSSRRTIDICSVNCPEGRISLTMKKR